MFSLEIAFKDDIAQSEMIMVRRPQGLIGSSEYAHVVVEDMKQLGYQIRLVRNVGRTFVCKTSAKGSEAGIASELDGCYEGEADLNPGPVRLHISALDFDLQLKESEPPDKAGVRVLRRACAAPSPLFPAVVVRGTPPMVVSFSPDQPLLIGRSKHCGLRLDSADISGRHARMGFEAGQFWIEDLGSTNGTYVNQQQISGRVSVPPGAMVVLGREVNLAGVTCEEEAARSFEMKPEKTRKTAETGTRYPMLVSVSEVARPAKLIMGPGSSVALGRDPSCEMWLGAPHVSRRHCSVTLSKEGRLTVTDSSTNGTAYHGGLLARGDTMEVGQAPEVLDFGGGVTVAICFTDEQERIFAASGGALDAFTNGAARAESFVEPEAAASSELSQEQRAEPESGEHQPRGLVQRLVTFYRRLGKRERLLMLVIVIALIAVAGVLAGLLLPVLTRLEWK